MYKESTPFTENPFMGSQFQENPLSINNAADHSLLYKISTPFMIMLETCDEENNCMKITQFSPFEHDSPLCLQYSFSDMPEQYHTVISSARPLHRHSFLEIMYVISGSVTNKVENQIFTYTAGQCCIMNKNIRHSEYFNGNFEAVFFMLKDSFIQEVYTDYLKLLSSSVLSDTSDHPFFQMYLEDIRKNTQYEKIYLDYFPLLPSNEVTQCISGICSMIQNNDSINLPGTSSIITGLFARFLHFLNDPAKFRVSQIRSDASSQEYLFAKIKNIMKSSHGRCSREELSAQLHYNSEYLNRIVKKYTGKSVLEYGQSIYLEEARKMLSETEMSISDIITELGFSNRSHFYRLFERQFGVTPKQYREKTIT